MTTKTKTKGPASKVTSLPVSEPTDGPGEYKRRRARHRDELDALVESLDATVMPEERSLPALLAMAAGEGHSTDLAFCVVNEVRMILNAKAGENCEDEIAMMCVRKLDAALELMDRQRATPTAELEARPAFRAG